MPNFTPLSPREGGVEDGHALMIITPILMVLGILQMGASGGVPSSLFSGGIALLLSVAGGYRVYVAWREVRAAPQNEGVDSDSS